MKEVKEYFEEKKPKGEFVIIVEENNGIQEIYR